MDDRSRYAFNRKECGVVVASKKRSCSRREQRRVLIIHALFAFFLDAILILIGRACRSPFLCFVCSSCFFKDEEKKTNQRSQNDDKQEKTKKLKTKKKRNEQREQNVTSFRSFFLDDAMPWRVLERESALWFSIHPFFNTNTLTTRHFYPSLF